MQLRKQDVVAVQVHDQAVLLRIDLQLPEDRQRLVRLLQRKVGSRVVAAVVLGEVIEAALERWRRQQPLLDRGLVLGGVPVAEHYRMGIGEPVDMVIVVSEHALDLAYVVRAGALLAARMGDPGQQRVTLQQPAVADVFEYLDALQRALLGGIQMVPLKQHLTTHAVDELHDRGRLQVGLFDVLDRPFLQRIGLL